MAHPPGSPYNTADYRRARRQFIAEAPPWCTMARCLASTRYVDKTLSGMHPLGPTIEHTTPTSIAPDAFWSGWTLAHRVCNTARGNRTEGDPLGERARDW